MISACLQGRLPESYFSALCPWDADTFVCGLSKKIFQPVPLVIMKEFMHFLSCACPLSVLQ